MAQKVKKWEEWLTLSGETLKVISYADYFARKPLFSSLQIKNASEEAVDGLTLTLTNEHGMLVDCVKTLEEIPFESVVQIELGELLSPHYFASIERVGEETVEVILTKNGKSAFLPLKFFFKCVILYKVGSATTIRRKKLKKQRKNFGGFS